MVKLQNLGMKESIAVEPASLFPKTELGSSKFSVVNVNMKSLLGMHLFSKVNSIFVFESSDDTSFRGCEWDLENIIFLSVRRLTTKFQ